MNVIGHAAHMRQAEKSERGKSFGCSARCSMEIVMKKRKTGLWAAAITAGIAAVVSLIVLFSGTEKKPEQYYQFSATEAVSMTVRSGLTGKGYTFSRTASGRELEAVMQYVAQGSFRRTGKAEGGTFRYELKFYNALGEEVDAFTIISETELVHEGYRYDGDGEPCGQLLTYLDKLFGAK